MSSREHSRKEHSRKEGAAVVGVGVAACAVCCAGPIGGFLVAIGLGTAAGIAVFGTIAVVAGVLAVLILVLRRRRRASACPPVDEPVLLTTGRPRAPAEPSSSSTDL
jgi:hypothetical protein